MNDKIYILAIESSCDETAASVVENGRVVLSNIISSQIEEHEKFGGVVPEIASRKHIEAINYVVKKALEKANLKLEDMKAIAVTTGPGLVGGLLVGVQYAKGLSMATKLPLISVNHIEGHICANYISSTNLEPPFITLIVSGGNTMIINVKGYGDYEVVGSSRDDAAGEAFDKVARVLGLGYPGGPKIDKIALNGDENKIKFPIAKFKEKSYDFSFSGLKSSVISYIHNSKQRCEDIIIEDVAASFQKAVSDVLIENTFKYCKENKINTIAICGGVASNSYIRLKFEEKGSKENIYVLKPDIILCTDNAAMIGAAAYQKYLKNEFSNMNINATANMKL